MKKIILILLCFVLLLSGCQSLPKAEPYFSETREDVTFNTQYNYYFDDEINIRCLWKNESTEEFSFYDTFELHVLGNDGEWYLLSKGDEVSFNTNYSHGLKPESETSSRYDLSVYADKIVGGKTYRISTYFFDDNGNNYQVFAEFTCDNKLAEEEMKEVTGSSKREDLTDAGSPEIIKP